MKPEQLASQLPQSALAFRGYNITNLGRSLELLEHAPYTEIVSDCLQEASSCASQALGRKVDLGERIRRQQETELSCYGDALALILAMSVAQLRILQDKFQLDYHRARFAFGYSFGEISALVATGVVQMREALPVPLSVEQECILLAHDVTMGVFFSRGKPLERDVITRLCQQINQQDYGVIGVSAYITPNSILLMGQADTLDRFKKRADEEFPDRVFLRKNEHEWPPLHTPIVWQQCLSDRCANRMLRMPVDPAPAEPRVFSLVTGDFSYNDLNARDLLHQWIDHPQLLWEAVCAVLSGGVETVIHVGPQPNLIPATFTRLGENVIAQTKASFGMRAMSSMVTRPWLQYLLPRRTALLRAPLIQQINLEDWLLEHKDSC